MLRERPLCSTDVICYCSTQNTVPYSMQPAFPSKTATFQESLGMATGGPSVEGRT